MKKLVVLIVLSFATMSSSFANVNPELRKEISNKIIVDLSRVELKNDKTDFVVVSFKIVDEEIVIESISGSMIELTEIMKRELNDMQIDSNYEHGKTYQYKFTFKKQ